MSLGTDRRILDLHQAAPYRLLLPSSHDVGARLAVLANISGGLVAGDHLKSHFEARDDARLMVVAQAAEKAYDCRLSHGAKGVRIEQSFAASGAAWLEVLPRELIMFDGAQVDRTFDCQVQDQAQMLIGDVSVLGRTHMGEQVCAGRLRDTWSLDYEGQLAYLDRQDLCLDRRDVREGVAALEGHPCFGTLLYAGPKPEIFVETVRAHPSAAPVKLATSGFDAHAVARLMAPDAKSLMQVYGNLWQALRQALEGLPASLPPLWHM